jgi:hypothetical protein
VTNQTLRLDALVLADGFGNLLRLEQRLSQSDDLRLGVWLGLSAAVDANPSFPVGVAVAWLVTSLMSRMSWIAWRVSGTGANQVIRRRMRHAVDSGIAKSWR